MTTAADLIAKAKRVNEEASALREYWLTILPEEHCPDIRQFKLWLSMYGGLDNCIAGVDRTAVWLSKCESESAEIIADGGQPDPPKTTLDIIQYASKVMRNKRDGLNADGEPDRRARRSRGNLL
jgi:hypothetical protein